MTPMIVYCPPSLTPLNNELTAALWISDEPVAPFRLKLCSCERQESQSATPHTQSSPAAAVPQRCSSLLKPGTRKMTSNCPLFRPVTLFVMELEVALSSNIVEEKQKG